MAWHYKEEQVQVSTRLKHASVSSSRDLLRLRCQVLLLHSSGLIGDGVHAGERAEHRDFEPLKPVRGARLMLVVALK